MDQQRSSVFKLLNSAFEKSTSIRQFNKLLEPLGKRNIFGSERSYKAYLDMRVYFTQRVFGKQLSMLIQDRKQLMSESQLETCYSRDMTLYQLVPYELHNSYFFEAIKAIFGDSFISQDLPLLR